MIPFNRQHKQAFGLAGAITAVLVVVGAVWLYGQRPTPAQPGAPSDVVSDEIIDAGLRYTQTLPWIGPGQSTVYQRADVLGDGVIGLVYTGAMPLEGLPTRQSYLVLYQNGHIIGHETRVSDAEGFIEIAAPEPEQILPRDGVLVRATTKEAGAIVTLTVRRDTADGIVVYEEQRVSSADRLAAFIVPVIPAGITRIMLSLASEGATVQFPVSIDISQ